MSFFSNHKESFRVFRVHIVDIAISIAESATSRVEIIVAPGDLTISCTNARLMCALLNSSH